MNSCHFCERKNLKLYKVYSLGFKTKTTTFDIGLTILFNQLGEYLMKRGFYLSASQIVLLRHDILEDFLMKYKTNGKKIVDIYLKDRLICKNCFNTYAELVPLK